MSLQLEDKNGDDKSLAIITDEMIEMYTEDYRSIKRRVFTKGRRSSGVEGYYEDCDNEYTKTDIGSLTGLYICNSFLGSGSEVTYKFDSKVKEGNFKIVITGEDNKILYDVAIDEETEVTFVANAGEIYYVKFIGESANILVEVTRLT